MASIPSQTIGPFFNPLMLRAGENDLVAGGPVTGEVVSIEGRVLQEGGVPVAGALVEIWQANADGEYVRGGAGGFTGFGRALSDAEGRYGFRTVKPGPVPSPGNVLQAPHILVSVFAAGLLRRLVTRIYFEGDPLNDTDPVLATVDDPVARETLLARLEVREGRPTCRFDIVLRGEGETAFFAD